MDFSDVAFVSTMAGHYVQNTGDKDLVFLEMFAASEFQEISPHKWLRALPRQASVGHTNLKEEDLERIPADGNPVIR
jgi:oxalate decarboxylase